MRVLMSLQAHTSQLSNQAILYALTLEWSQGQQPQSFGGRLHSLGLVPSVSVMYRRIWAGSEDRLNIQFNPAALLSLGDAHAFVEALLDIAPKAPGVPKGGPTPSTVSTNTKMAQLDSGPEMVEQMAQRGAITSR